MRETPGHNVFLLLGRSKNCPLPHELSLDSDFPIVVALIIPFIVLLLKIPTAKLDYQPLFRK